jgi:hypothetical protein
LPDDKRTDGGVTAEGYVSLITGGVGAVTVLAIFLSLILAGKLHTEGEFNREVRAHDKTRKALEDMTKSFEAASQRVDAAVRVSELVTEAFTKAAASHRRPGGGRGGS